MTSSVAKPHQLAEVAGLAASIAARIIEKQVEGVAISPELFRHLVQAAQILTDNGAPWPPSVDLIFTEVGRRVAANQGRREWATGQPSASARLEAVSAGGDPKRPRRWIKGQGYVRHKEDPEGAN